MAEQIKFEMDSDEVLDILKKKGDTEHELGTDLWKTALKTAAMGCFKNEAALKIAIEAVKKQIPMKPTRIKKGNYVSDIYRCECCKQFIAVIPIVTKYCDTCGQRLCWGEEDATD